MTVSVLEQLDAILQTAKEKEEERRKPGVLEGLDAILGEMSTTGRQPRVSLGQGDLNAMMYGVPDGAEIGPLARPAKEFVKGAARGVQSQIIGGIGAMVRWAAERASIGNVLTAGSTSIPGQAAIVDYLVRKYGPQKAVKAFEDRMDFYADKGARWANWWDEQANKGWEAPDPEVAEAKWSQAPVSKAGSAIGQGLPSYMQAIAASILTKNPQVGLVLLSAQAGSSAYHRQREAGGSKTKSNLIGAMTAAWEYVTEKIPFEEVFKPAKKLFHKMLKTGAMEGAQEFIQGIGENFLEHFGYNVKGDDPSTIPGAAKEGVAHMLDDWLDNVVAGFGLGFAGGGIGGSGPVQDRLANAKSSSRKDVADALGVDPENLPGELRTAEARQKAVEDARAAAEQEETSKSETAEPADDKAAPPVAEDTEKAVDGQKLSDEDTEKAVGEPQEDRAGYDMTPAELRALPDDYQDSSTPGDGRRTAIIEYLADNNDDWNRLEDRLEDVEMGKSPETYQGEKQDLYDRMEALIADFLAGNDKPVDRGPMMPQDASPADPAQLPGKAESEAGEATNTEKPTPKVSHTSVPDAWKKFKTLRSWGSKGLRTPNNDTVAGRKTFIWADELEQLPTGLPRFTLKAIQDRTDEVWRVEVRKKGEKGYWLAPKRVIDAVRAELGDEAFVPQKKKPPSPRQLLTYAVQAMKMAVKRGEIEDWAVGKGILDLAAEYDIDPDSLPDSYKKYIQEYRDYEQETGSVASGVAEADPEAGLDPEAAAEREAIQSESKDDAEIGDFLDGLYEPEDQPPQKITGKKLDQDKALLGREETKGGTSGSQKEMLDKDKYKTVKAQEEDIAKDDIEGQRDFFGGVKKAEEKPAPKPKPKPQDQTGDLFPKEGTDYDDVTPPPGSSPGSFSATYAAERPEPGTNPARPPTPESSELATLALPELVHIANELNKYPKVKRKLRKRGALGLFRHDKETGRIELRADIFIGPLIKAVRTRTAKANAVIEVELFNLTKLMGLNSEDIVARTEKDGRGYVVISFYKRDPNWAPMILAHEIGHLVDWLPDRAIEGRGNILGRIATLKRFYKGQLESYPGGPGPLTKAERARLKRLAKKMLGKAYEVEVDEYIEKTVGITPKDVIAVLNTVADQMHKIDPKLHDFIKKADRVLKKSIFVEAMKGRIHDALKSMGKTVKEPTGRKIKQVIEPDASPEAIAAKYRELLLEEVKKRMLLDAGIVTNELKALSKWWNPFDVKRDAKYTAYRFSSPELYADAISVLLNNPGALKARAPMFYQGFFGWLSQKPEMKKLYNQVIDEIKSGANMESLEARLLAGFDKGDAAAFEAQKRKVGQKARDLWPALKVAILEKAQVIKSVLRGDIDDPNKDPGLAIDSAIYSSSSRKYYLAQLRHRVIARLDKHNLSHREFGLYLLYLRTTHDRADIANTQGITPATATRLLAEQKKRLGDKAFAAMEKARKAFWKIRKYVIALAKDSQLFSQEEIAHISDNEYYSTWKPIEELDKAHGKGTGVRIFRQIGFLGDIQNPFTRTLENDVMIISAAHWNTAKQMTIESLRTHKPDMVRPIRQQWRKGSISEVDPENPDRRLVVYMKDGRPAPYYVDKWMAKAFESESNTTIQAVGTVLHVLAAAPRLLLTIARPGFWTFNAVRDFARTVKNVPGAGRIIPNKEGGSIWRLLKNYGKAAPKGVLSEYNLPDRVVNEMLKGNMLLSVADPHGWTTEDKRLERQLYMYAGIGKERWHNGVTKPFKALFYHVMRFGGAVEQTGKIAPYMYLRETYPDMPEAKLADMIRRQAGSPPFLIKGEASPITNNFFLYSNPIIQSWRADIDVIRERPAEAMWNNVKYALLPTMIKYGFYSGAVLWLLKALLDDDDEEKWITKWARAQTDMLRNVGEYHLTNYHVIPLGLTPDGKTVCVRVPMDEGQRFLGGLFWKILNHEEQDLSTLPMAFDYTMDQLPGLNPMILAGKQTVDYFNGINPYDAFRDRRALDDTLFEARTMETHLAFVKYLSNQLGGGIVYQFKDNDIESVKLELQNVLGYDLTTPIPAPGVAGATEAPVLGDIVGRWIKITDQGKSQAARRGAADANRENARENLRIRKIADKLVKDEPLTEAEQALVEKEGQKVASRVQRNIGRNADAYTRTLAAAKTTDARHAMQLAIKKREGEGFDLTPYAENDIVAMADALARPIPVRIRDRDEYLAARADALDWLREREISTADVLRLYRIHLQTAIKTPATRTEKMERVRRALR